MLSQHLLAEDFEEVERVQYAAERSAQEPAVIGPSYGIPNAGPLADNTNVRASHCAWVAAPHVPTSDITGIEVEPRGTWHHDDVSVAAHSKVEASDSYRTVSPLPVPAYHCSTCAPPVTGYQNPASSYGQEGRTNLNASTPSNCPCTGDGILHGGNGGSPKLPPAKRQSVAPNVEPCWNTAGNCALKLNLDRRQVVFTATVTEAAATTAPSLLTSSEAVPLPWGTSLTSDHLAQAPSEASRARGSYSEGPLQINAKPGFGAAPNASWLQRQSALPSASSAVPPADLPQQAAPPPYPSKQPYQLSKSLQYSHQHNTFGGPHGLHPCHPTFTRQQQGPQQQQDTWPVAPQRQSHGQSPQTWPQQQVEFGWEKRPMTGTAEITAGRWQMHLETRSRRGHTAAQHVISSALGGTYDQLQHQQPQPQPQSLSHPQLHLQPQQHLLMLPSCKQDDEHHTHLPQTVSHSCAISAASTASPVLIQSIPPPNATSFGEGAARVSDTGTGSGSEFVNASMELMRQPSPAPTLICQPVAPDCTGSEPNLNPGSRSGSEIKQPSQFLPQAQPQPQTRPELCLHLQPQYVCPLAHGSQLTRSVQSTRKAPGPPGQRHSHPRRGTQQPMSLPAKVLCVPPPPAAALVGMQMPVGGQRNVPAGGAGPMPLQQQLQGQQQKPSNSEQRLSNRQHIHLPNQYQSLPPSQLSCNQPQKAPEQQQQPPQQPPQHPPSSPLPRHRHHQQPQHGLYQGDMSPRWRAAAPAALPGSPEAKCQLCPNKCALRPHAPKTLDAGLCGDASGARGGAMGPFRATATATPSTTTIARASASFLPGSSYRPAAPEENQCSSCAYPSAAAATAATEPLNAATAANAVAYPPDFCLLHAAVGNSASGVPHGGSSAVVTAAGAAGDGQPGGGIADPAAVAIGYGTETLENPAACVGACVSGIGHCGYRSSATTITTAVSAPVIAAVTTPVTTAVGDPSSGCEEASGRKVVITGFGGTSHIGSAFGGCTGTRGGGPGRRLPASLAAVTCSAPSNTALPPGIAAAASMPAAAKGNPAARGVGCPGAAALAHAGDINTCPPSLPSIAEVRAARAAAAAANGPVAKQPVLQFEGRVRYAATAVEVDWLCRELLAARPPVIGLDMEWRPHYVAGSPANPTALLQICYAVPAGHPGYLALGADRPPSGRHHGQATTTTDNNNNKSTIDAITTDNNNIIIIDAAITAASGCVGADSTAVITSSTTVCGGTACGASEAPRRDPGRDPSNDTDKAAAAAAAADTCTGRHCCCLLLHIIHSGVTPRLRALLEAEEPCKVGVNITGDANKLKRDYGVEMRGTTELDLLANDRVFQHIAHVTINTEYRSRWSLSALVETVLRRQLPKPNNIRCGNWEKRPLDAAQQRYAALDAYAGLAVWAALLRLPRRRKAPLIVPPVASASAPGPELSLEAIAADLATGSNGADGHAILGSNDSSASAAIGGSVVARDCIAAAGHVADSAIRRNGNKVSEPGDAGVGAATAAARDRSPEVDH
ncbi:hypothetical protein VaNZ11_009434 [Volvox africanus]|uniref:3'-5' exonuclease n=1 Tax=Volvox africanus TaxID=51714 RepID=A0ABQ5S9E1_9CHLO|nr:hypothetical protein VaNZ11_009434 [Volvox africanus]